MKSLLPLLLLLAAVIAVPIALRRGEVIDLSADDTVVVITPHTESIRQEFGRGFAEWYRERTGRTVYVDFRVIGGTSEIARFVESEYANAFRRHWTDTLGRPWTTEVAQAYANSRLTPDDTPEDDTPAEAARRAYLASDVTCGLDVFFGGGAYDFSVQAGKGNLVDAGLLKNHPQWFTETAPAGTVPAAIPRTFAGETYYDKEGRWYGAVLSSYGIIFNRERLRALGLEEDPSQWIDLTDPRYYRQIAVCDPTKSGSMTQAFEMIVQQQMQLRLAELQAAAPTGDPAELETQAVEEGWARGMAVIQLISANARYFTDTSQKPNIDVAAGDCAAGMSIDFYGRFQEENILERSNDPRFGFAVPTGGTTISCDPIGLFRGARHHKVAVAFLEYVLSLEGQKLWNFRVGEPGGPKLYALRRPPIRPELYQDSFNSMRSDEDYVPYVDAQHFRYEAKWTSPLFSELRTIIRIAFIDVRPELTEAWGAIIEARKAGRTAAAERAWAVFSDLSKISYTEAGTTIDAALKAPPIEEVQVASGITKHFQQQFLRAARIARGEAVE